MRLLRIGKDGKKKPLTRRGSESFGVFVADRAVKALDPNVPIIIIIIVLFEVFFFEVELVGDIEFVKNFVELFVV